MLAIERTTEQFIASVKEAMPEASIQIERSRAAHGRSNYVYIYFEHRAGGTRVFKVRISDHPVGMRRATSGHENLYIDHKAKPASWAVWISRLPKKAGTPSPWPEPRNANHP